MDRTDHCDRPHAWQRYLAKVSLPRMGTDSIVERHRRSACAWAGSYAACAEAIHLFPILTIALTASTASGLDLVLRLQIIAVENSIGQLGLAEELPDVFGGVEL